MAWRQSKGSIHQKRISLDYVKNKLASTARDMTEKAKEYGQYMQHKVQEKRKEYKKKGKSRIKYQILISTSKEQGMFFFLFI